MEKESNSSNSDEMFLDGSDSRMKMLQKLYKSLKQCASSAQQLAHYSIAKKKATPEQEGELYENYINSMKNLTESMKESLFLCENLGYNMDKRKLLNSTVYFFLCDAKHVYRNKKGYTKFNKSQRFLAAAIKDCAMWRQGLAIKLKEIRQKSVKQESPQEISERVKKRKSTLVFLEEKLAKRPDESQLLERGILGKENEPNNIIPEQQNQKKSNQNDKIFPLKLNEDINFNELSSNTIKIKELKNFEGFQPMEKKKRKATASFLEEHLESRPEVGELVTKEILEANEITEEIKKNKRSPTLGKIQGGLRGSVGRMFKKGHIRRASANQDLFEKP